MIARTIRGNGFKGCLSYVLRERRQDKDKYTPLIHGPKGGAVSCPGAPMAVIVIRTTYRGGYIGTVLDRGDLLTAIGYPTDKAAAWHLAQQSAAKGWDKVEASGSDEFLQWNYDFLLSRSIDIITKDDHQANILARVKADRAAAGKDKWAKILPPEPFKPPTKLKAPMIVGGNMTGTSVKELCREFAAGRRQRPGCKKPVWHSPISLAIGEHLSQEQWQSLADNYMQKMGFGSRHEYIVVQHFDREYEHVHIVANRIGLDGQLWAGKWELKRAQKITNELAREFSLQEVEIKAPMRQAPTQAEFAKMERTGLAPERLVLQKLIDTALQGNPTTLDFLERLEGSEVVVRPNIASTGRMNGFAFAMAGSKIFFSGKKLGKKYTWKKLLEVIDYEQNRDSSTLYTARDKAQQRANTADCGGSRVVYADCRNQGKRTGNSLGSLPGNIGGKRAKLDPKNSARSGRGNNCLRIENQQDGLSCPGSSSGKSSNKHLAGGNNKRPGRGANLRSSEPDSAVRRWPFVGPYQFLEDWWDAYLTSKGDNRESINRVAEQTQNMLAAKTDIFPAFSDDSCTYYVKAVAEILLKSSRAVKLSGDEINNIIRQVMLSRERPDEQIHAVLAQSPIANHRLPSSKITTDIAPQLAKDPAHPQINSG